MSPPNFMFARGKEGPLEKRAAEPTREIKNCSGERRKGPGPRLLAQNHHNPAKG